MGDRRLLLAITVAWFVVAFHLAAAVADDKPVPANVVKFARFKVNDNIAFGIVEGGSVRELSGTIFGDWEKTDKVYALSGVTLMVPTRPRQVFAMAGQGIGYVRPLRTVYRIRPELQRSAAHLAGQR